MRDQGANAVRVFGLGLLAGAVGGAMVVLLLDAASPGVAAHARGPTAPGEEPIPASGDERAAPADLAGEIGALRRALEAMNTDARTGPQTGRSATARREPVEPYDTAAIVEELRAIRAELRSLGGRSSPATLRDRPEEVAYAAQRYANDETTRRELLLLTQRELVERFGKPTRIRHYDENSRWTFSTPNGHRIVVSVRDGVVTHVNHVDVPD